MGQTPERSPALHYPDCITPVALLWTPLYKIKAKPIVCSPPTQSNDELRPQKPVR